MVRRKRNPGDNMPPEFTDYIATDWPTFWDWRDAKMTWVRNNSTNAVAAIAHIRGMRRMAASMGLSTNRPEIGN